MRLILGAVKELSRTPVVELPNGMAICWDGDVLIPKPNHSVGIEHMGKGAAFLWTYWTDILPAMASALS